jgi:hypothetical protein
MTLFASGRNDGMGEWKIMYKDKYCVFGVALSIGPNRVGFT